MRKPIYIRMPRCGSTTIVDVCSKNNIKYYGGRGMGFWGYDTILKKNTSEKLHECISNYVGEKVYDESFVFTTARNPYSRAVSMFKHVSWKSVKSFKYFCHKVIKNEYPSKCARWHSSTITEHIVDNDHLKVDFVIKLENFQEDFDTICDKIGIPHQQLPHKNKSKSKHKHYTEYYDEETKQIIAENYAKDIEYFGYEFGK